MMRSIARLCLAMALVHLAGGALQAADKPVRRTAPTWKRSADRPATGRGLRVGDRAPDFSLRSAAGKRVGLSEVRARGPVVLVFFRGHW